MSFSEISLRVASLNTQLRFRRHQSALTEAYKLRSYIQLRGGTSEEAVRALHRAERVIETFEGKFSSTIQQLVKIVVQTIQASLNPHDENNEATFLDQLAREEHAALDLKLKAQAMIPDFSEEMNETPTSTATTDPTKPEQPQTQIPQPSSNGGSEEDWSDSWKPSADE